MWGATPPEPIRFYKGGSWRPRGGRAGLPGQNLLDAACLALPDGSLLSAASYGATHTLRTRGFPGPWPAFSLLSNPCFFYFCPSWELFQLAVVCFPGEGGREAASGSGIRLLAHAPPVADSLGCVNMGDGGGARQQVPASVEL